MVDQMEYLKTLALVKSSLHEVEFSPSGELSKLESDLKNYHSLVFFKPQKITSLKQQDTNKQLVNLKNIDNFSGSIEDLFDKINED